MIEKSVVEEILARANIGNCRGMHDNVSAALNDNALYFILTKTLK